MNTKTLPCSDGTDLEVLPIGTRVADSENPALTGTIRRYEYHESGRISPLPYNIQWDDCDLAYRVRGFMFIYAGPGIEAVQA